MGMMIYKVDMVAVERRPDLPNISLNDGLTPIYYFKLQMNIINIDFTFNFL